MQRTQQLAALLPMLLTGCLWSDPEHTAYLPDTDGNKPEIFEHGFVQVCESGTAAIRGAARFASERGMYKEKITDPGKRILVVYTLGEPMREHLMVERLYQNRYRVGISTFRGHTSELVIAARRIDFCGVARERGGA